VSNQLKECRVQQAACAGMCQTQVRINNKRDARQLATFSVAELKAQRGFDAGKGSTFTRQDMYRQNALMRTGARIGGGAPEAQMMAGGAAMTMAAPRSGGAQTKTMRPSHSSIL
jgi:hypothetical protein